MRIDRAQLLYGDAGGGGHPMHLGTELGGTGQPFAVEEWHGFCMFTSSLHLGLIP